jgi:hypothetical protein
MLAGLKVGNVGNVERKSPPGDLGSVARKELAGGLFGSVAMIGLTGEFSDVWQGKDLGEYGTFASRERPGKTKEQSNGESQSEKRIRREDPGGEEAAGRCWSLTNTWKGNTPVSTCQVNSSEPQKLGVERSWGRVEW